jgi:acyl-[acyl-carrier-protein]-phospholipid O-acyltransferase/long-chain-fatty-acid--[acyl-carrier-protein] ligase
MDLCTDIAGIDAKNLEAYVDTLPSLPEMIVRSMKRTRAKTVICDASGVALSPLKFLAAIFAFSQTLKSVLKDCERVGVCLPTSVGGVIGLLAVLMLGKVPVLINYTASPEGLDYMVEHSNITHVLSSSLFMRKLKGKGFDLEPYFSKLTVLHLEDYKAKLSKLTMLSYLIKAKTLSAAVLVKRFVAPAPGFAAIVFTSGSESLPKGACITPKHILMNVTEAIKLIRVTHDDSVLGILPMFHAFGLAITIYIPLLAGLNLVCHPDPREAKIIGKLCEKYKPTVMCASNTILRLYANSKGLSDMAFASFRIVVAGAERLQSHVREAFEARFNQPLYEGYGATELGPGVSCNTPWQNKKGSVGKPLDSITIRILDPKTFEPLPEGTAGLIVAAGPSVMERYLNDPAKTKAAFVEQDGRRWYKTGDKGYIDDDGFLVIAGRYSRFAKIGGEMIPLNQVQDALLPFLPKGAEALVVALPHAKKGEQLVLVYAGATQAVMKTAVKSADLSNLYRPNVFVEFDEIPVLGSGKTDYTTAQKRVASKI